MSDKKQTTRAELVRKRRQERATKELTQTAQRAVKPVPTVTTRKTVTYAAKTMTIAPTTTQNQPRRFKVALSLPHFHLPQIAIRRPSVNVKPARGSWRLASFFMIVILGTALYLGWTIAYFRVPASTVLGNNRLSRDEINNALGVTGQSIFMVVPEEAETRLRLNYPELASAKVDVYLPNYVFVTVAERQPVIQWQMGEAYTWVDPAGVAFRPRGQAAGPLVTVLGLATPPAGTADADDPLSPPPFIKKELVDAILVLAPSVPAGSTLTYDPTEGLGWKDSRGWNVYFGTNTQDMILKLRVYQSLVDSLVSQGKTPEYINVSFPDAPYYRMAKPLEEESQPTATDNGQ